MIDNSPFDNFEMQLNESAKGFLQETAKWAYFLSIIGFIGLGFIVIMAIFGSAALASTTSLGDNSLGAMGATFIAVFYLVIAGIYFFPIYYLNRFASKMKQAFRENNAEALTESLGYLKSHYKFIGIFTIIFLALYVLIIVGALLFGLSTAM